MNALCFCSTHGDGVANTHNARWVIKFRLAHRLQYNKNVNYTYFLSLNDQTTEKTLKDVRAMNILNDNVFRAH